MEKSYGDHINLLTMPGEAFFHPEFFNEADSYRYFDQLYAMMELQKGPVHYGDEELKVSSWTPVLLEIKESIENKFDVQFNTAVLNLYQDGTAGRGWHRDNDRSLGKYPAIAAVSFGASRIFQFRNYKDKLPIISIELTHGSLLMMKAETQVYWEQRQPKTSVVTQPRINLTFKLINL